MNIWWYIVVVKVMHIHEIFVAKDDDHKSFLFLVFFWVTPYSRKSCLFFKSLFSLLS